MTVEIPDMIAKLLPTEPVQRDRSVMEGLVLGAYTQRVISRGRACELLGLNYWDGERFLSARGVSVNYDFGEFQHDMRG